MRNTSEQNGARHQESDHLRLWENNKKKIKRHPI